MPMLALEKPTIRSGTTSLLRPWKRWMKNQTLISTRHQTNWELTWKKFHEPLLRPATSTLFELEHATLVWGALAERNVMNKPSPNPVQKSEQAWFEGTPTSRTLELKSLCALSVKIYTKRQTSLPTLFMMQSNLTKPPDFNSEPASQRTKLLLKKSCASDLEPAVRMR